MASRIVARSSAVGAIVALLTVGTAGAAIGAPASPPGGGAVEDLIELPDGFRRGHNRTVVEGGRKLWEELPDPAAHQSDEWIFL